MANQTKLFAAETMAEIRRARAAEEERSRVDKSVRSMATAMTAKACAMVEEFVARSRRMAGRVTELRESAKVRFDTYPRASSVCGVSQPFAVCCEQQFRETYVVYLLLLLPLLLLLLLPVLLNARIRAYLFLRLICLSGVVGESFFFFTFESALVTCI